jgi:putative flippase GtrA
MRLGGLVARFGLVGLANTVLGLAVIAALDLGLGLDPHLANAAGYGAGLLVGFLLNRSFVFRSKAAVAGAGARFAVAALCCFALNQAALSAAGVVLEQGDWRRLAAQMIGMGVYSVSLFLVCRYWVFRERPEMQGG